MYIIGLNIEKVDPSATLYKDCKIICHVEEERFTRIKRASGQFPAKSLEYCINQIPDKIGGLAKIIVGLDLDKIIKELPIKYINEWMQYPKKDYHAGIYEKERLIEKHPERVKSEIRQALINIGIKDSSVPEIIWFEHHYCHALSSHLTSPFENSLGIVIDGDAEVDCVSIYDCRGTNIRKIYTKELPNSLGWYYKAFTLFCGFDRLEGPGMLMGLAPYGETNLQIREKIKKVLAWAENDKGEFEFSVDPEFLYLCERYSENKHLTLKMIEVFGKPSENSYDPEQYYKDVALESQDRLEKTLYKIFDRFLVQTGHEYVTFSGGVALNCKATGFIWKNNERIKDIYIVPFAGDDGIGIGACQAFLIKENFSNNRADYNIPSIYLGSEYNDKEIKNTFGSFIIRKDFKKPLQYEALSRTLNMEINDLKQTIQDNSINKLVTEFISERLIYSDHVTSVCAKLLAQKYLVAFFQGRMEAGPRALGNRSILGNPTSIDVLDILNKKVKFRQPWRPFCPTVLDEFKAEYFFKTTQSPYMINTFTVTDKAIKEAPAIVHIDGTARPQFLTKEHNPLFYELISKFNEITGVPILLNTSLNIKGEPICMSPNDAINFFFATNIDVLCIGKFIISKENINISNFMKNIT